MSALCLMQSAWYTGKTETVLLAPSSSLANVVTISSNIVIVAAVVLPAILPIITLSNWHTYDGINMQMDDQGLINKDPRFIVVPG